MPDWLQKSFATDVEVALTLVVVRQLFAFALGCVVAGVYRLSHGKPGNQSLEMMATLVLLTVLIAMMTAVIGDNVARAFSIVGALSIVRFRTVVEDTRDTAFVIFAVAVGLAVGAGHLLIPVVTIPIVAIAAHLFRPRKLTTATAESNDYILTVRVGAAHSEDRILQESFARSFESVRLLAMSSARQGAAFEKSYAVSLRNQQVATNVVGEIHGIEGVQSVELRRS